jgi:hypothetical protein
VTVRKLKSWQVGALGALVVAAAALGVSKGKQIAHAVVGPADRHLRFQLEWQRGEKLTYAFTWRGKSETSFAALGATSPPRDGKMMEGSVDLDGDLVVESYGARDGAFLLREHVEHLRRHEVRALDHDVIPTDDDAKAAFDGKSVLVAVDAAGTVRGMYFAKGEAPIFQHVMQSLVTETSVTVAERRRGLGRRRNDGHGDGAGALRGRGDGPASRPPRPRRVHAARLGAGPDGEQGRRAALGRVDARPGPRRAPRA